jgi:hypothetical protein
MRASRSWSAASMKSWIGRPTISSGAQPKIRSEVEDTDV